MHTKTMVRKTLDKFERLKTEDEVVEPCYFCRDVLVDNAAECHRCKLAKRLGVSCVFSVFKKTKHPYNLAMTQDRAWWRVSPSKRRKKWLNGFVDFLQEWLDELEGKQ